MNDGPISLFKQRKSVVCPQCGSSVGVDDPNSFKLFFTTRSRSYLNGLLIDLRNFTRGLDSYLARRSAQFELYDVYGTPYKRDELLFLVSKGLIDDATNLDLYGKSVEGGNGEGIADGPDRIQIKNAVAAKAKDIPKFLSAHGEFQDQPKELAISRWADNFRLEADSHDFADNFKSFKDLPQNDEPAAANAVEDYSRLLLGVAIERRRNGLLLEVICEQEPFREFLKMGGFAKYRELMSLVVGKIRPSLGRYYEYIDKSMDKLKNDEQGKIKKNLDRALFLLTVLHGHAFKNLPEQDKKQIKEHASYTHAFDLLFLDHLFAFNDDTEVSVELLARLLNSKTLSHNKNDVLSDSLPPWKDHFFRYISALHGVLGFRENRWLNEIDRLVAVRCANDTEVKVKPVSVGSSKGWEWATQSVLKWVVKSSQRNHRGIGTQNRGTEQNIVDHSEHIYVPCSYPLAEKRTFNALVMGSKGTGKTCLFDSAIFRLSQCAESLGLDLVPVDLESHEKMKRIKRDALRGAIKEPTRLLFTINLEARRFEDSPNAAIRFSTLDYPGETFMSVVSGDGSDSELRRILRYTNAIVFQFDMWQDEQIRTALQYGDGGLFSKAQELAKNIDLQRSDTKENPDQRFLLSRLIDMLVSERGEEGAKRLPFICLFPKADLLIAHGPENQQRFVFTEMFRKLKECGVIVGGDDQNGILGHSMAGLGVDKSKFRTLLEEYNIPISDKVNQFGFQIILCKLISKMTEDSLSKLGNMLSERMPPAVKDSFKDRVHRGVVELIKKQFPLHYFIPVSALGTSPDTEGEGEQVKFKSLNRPADSLLPEYGFLLPLSIAFALDRKQTQQYETPEDTRLKASK